MQGTHQGKSARLWIAMFAASLLYAAAHPPWSLWPLALLATAPVGIVLLDPHARVPWPRAAAAGFLFGAMSTWLLVGHWSWLAAREFFAGSPLTAIGFTASLPLIASGVALHYAVAFALIARLAGLGAMAGVIGSAALWAAAELARTSLGYGNPWGSFAAALIAADNALSVFRAETPVGGLLSVGGPALVAMLAAAVGASLGLAWNVRHSAVERGRALATGAAMVVLSLAASYAGDTFVPARSDAAAPAQPLRVAIVQPGIGKSRLWERAGAAESFERHVDLTRGVETKGADLVVWPENALPFLLDANVDKRDALRELARDRGAALLVGGSRSVPGSDGRTSVFNSAFLFPADGSEPVAYDKRVLLPFLEFVPWWVAPFLESPWQGAFAPGQSVSAREHGASASERGSSEHGASEHGASEHGASASEHGASAGEQAASAGGHATPDLFTVKGWRIAPLLCFEAIYPGVTAARVAAGADLLVNLSNDSWFDAGAGPEQHFTLAMLAAAETRRPMVRVATTGVSALVGEEGLVSWRLPARVGTIALLDVVPPRRDSLFVRGGNVGVALLVLAIAGAAVALPGRIRRVGAGHG